jgi:hypothetical protein
MRAAAVDCGRARSTRTSGSVSTGEVSAGAGSGPTAVKTANSKDAITASRAPQSNGPRVPVTSPERGAARRRTRTLSPQRPQGIASGQVS